MKKQFFGFLLAFMSLGLSAAPALSRPAITSPSVISPIRPLPIWVGPRLVSSEMQLLLIDDQLANNQYITTLSSSGTLLPGGQQAAIFGARQRMGANRKSLTWYPHAVDKKIPVQQIYAPQPDAVFEGVSDRSGNVVGFNQGVATLPSANYVNLALSELAFARFNTVGLGSLNSLSYKEKLQDGSEREISTTLAKAATLTLQRPESNICRPDRVNGELGQICTVRSLRVQQGAAVSAGDLRFTARAKGATPVSQFRVGQRWYRLGESIALAEFASSKAIEVFVQQATPLSLKIGNTLEMGFYSPSRLAMGDRFNLLMGSGGVTTRPSEPSLSRLELLLVDDQVANNQYLTTISSSSQQAIYGVRRPQAFGGGSRPAAWYLGQVSVKDSGQSAVQPTALFNGFVDDKGQPSALGANPRLSESSFDLFSKMAAGDSALLSYGPAASPLRSHVLKGGQLSLGAPPSNNCRSETIDNVVGEVCVLRTVQSQFVSSSGGDIQFRVDAKGQSPDARIRVSETWRALSEPIPLAEFAKSRVIEVFSPAKTKAQQAAYKMFFYSGGKAARGDRFVAEGRVGAERVEGDNPLGLYAIDIFPDVVGGEPAINVWGFMKPIRATDQLLIAYQDISAVHGVDFDQTKVQITFDTGAVIRNLDLTTQKVLTLPAGAKQMFIAVPTKVNTKPTAKRFSITLALKNPNGSWGGEGYNLGSNNTILGASRVSNVSSPNIVGGNPAPFVVDLSNAAVSGDELFVKLAAGSAALGTDFDESKVDISFDQGSALLAQNLAGGKAISLPLGAKKITVSVPTKANLIASPKQFILSADVGTALSANKKTGTATIAAAVAPLVSSVSSPNIEGGSPAAFVLDLDKAALNSEKLFIKLAAGSAALGPDFDESKVDISFDKGSPLSAQNLAGGKAISLPLGAQKITVAVPTKANLLASPKQFTLSADVGTALNSNKKTGTATIAAAVLPLVMSVSNPSVKGGNPAAFVVDLDRATIGGEKLFVKLNAGSAAAITDFDETTVEISFDKGSILSPLNLTGGRVISLPIGAKQIILSVPTKANTSFKEKLFSLDAEVGSVLTAAKKTGTATIEKNSLPEIALSITPIAGDSTSGEMGGIDAKLAYKIKVNASNYTGRNIKQALLARTLRAGSTMLVAVDGPVGEGGSCSFLIENSPQAGKHALIPAYIEYAESRGPKKIFHGCRNEALDITAGRWNWQNDSSAQTLTGELDLTLGFVLSESASLYTVEDPSLKWVGAAKASGNITVRAEWNAPTVPLTK